MREKRRGFTLIEVIVTIAIMLMIAALLTPSLIGTLDRERVDAGQDTLDGLVTAISNFRSTIQVYPGFLTHLSTKITNTDTNSCGATYSNAQVNRWAAPFVTRVIPTTGVPVSIGTAANQLIRLPGANVTLRILVTGVTEEDAIDLNTQKDGDNSSTAGTVQWVGPDAEGFVVLSYTIPIAGC